MTKTERDAFFNGIRDADGETIERGVIAMRGLEAAEELLGWMEKLTEARAKKEETRA
nr:hypothetical protein [Microvirga vignae]